MRSHLSRPRARRLHPEEWIEQDLTRAAIDRRLRPAIGVEGPLSRLIEYLVDPIGRRRPVLVGPPGAGKTTIVAEIARRAAEGTLPAGIGNAHIARLSLRSVAGRLAEDADRTEMLERLLDRIDTAHPPRILFIEDLHVAHEQGWVAPILRFLARTHHPVFLESRRAGFDRLVAEHDAVASFLEPVEVTPPGREQLRTILQAWAAHEADLAVDISAIHLAADLAQRYLANEGAPRRAVALLRQTIALQPETRSEPIGPADVIDCFLRITRLPRPLVDPALPMDLDRLASGLRTRLPGQEHAVQGLVDSVALLKAGIGRTDRAAASLMFVGPAGSGRGRSAEFVAEEVFGDTGRLLRIDLSHYADEAGIRQLLGDRKALRRHDRQGLLGSMLERHPYGVLHLAHAEGANDEVLRTVAAALDRGAWIDGAGERWSLGGFFVIITVDAHTGAASPRGDRTTPRLVQASDSDWSVSLGFLPRELLRNVDRVVGFRDARQTSSHALIRRAIDDLVSRMGRNHPGLAIQVDDEALDWLSDRLRDGAGAFSPDVDRLVETHVASAVAVYLVSAGPEPPMPARLTLRNGRLRARGPAPRPAAAAVAEPPHDPHVARVRLWWAEDRDEDRPESAWLLLESTDGPERTRWLMDLLAMYRRWLGRHGARLAVVGEWVEGGELQRLAARVTGPDVLALLGHEAGEHHHLSRQGEVTGACVDVVPCSVGVRGDRRGRLVPVTRADCLLVDDPTLRLHLDLPRPQGELLLRGTDAAALRRLAADLARHFESGAGEPTLARVYDEQAGLAIDPWDNRSTTELRAVLAGALDAFRAEETPYDLQIEDDTVEIHPSIRQHMVQ
ncbi:MAG: ATP-dependent Clp protease ATP-binding subunit [Deltaproteobacteria bacterium]|nr:MAG: ATP-dependent Clp protease ATP-binding subunit [Deltaproteobacteria bacterium]